MNKPRFSGWLLGLHCGTQRAAEIVGDLQEQYGPAGLNGRTLLTVLVMSRRWSAAILLPAIFIVSPGLSGLKGGLSQHIFWIYPVIRWLHLAKDNPSGETWLNVLRILSTISWSVTLVCTIRHGLADVMTRVGLWLSFLLCVDTLFSYQVYARETTSFLIVAASAVVLWRRRSAARALWSLLAMAVAEVVALELFFRAPGLDFAWRWARHHHFLDQQRFMREFITLLTLADFIRWTLCAVVAAWIMTTTRKRFDLVT